MMALAEQAPTTTADASEVVEEWLDANRVKWQLIAIPLAEVDFDASHRNQARVSMPVIPEVVERYATAMKAGDRFPPIVAYQPKTQRRERRPAGLRYILIDGIQRAEAMRVNAVEFTWAYVVQDASDQQLSVLTYTANGKHGMPTSQDDRMVQAIYLVESGASASMAARLMSVDDKRLRQLIKRTTTERRLVTNGVVRWQTIGAQQIDRLAALRNDNVLKEAAQLVADARMSSHETNALVTSVNTKRNEKQQLQVIEEARAEREIDIRQSGTGILSLPQRVRFLAQAVGTLMKLDSDTLSEEISGLDGKYKESLKVRVTEAGRELRKIEGML